MESQKNRIKFLGTAGARFVVTRQLRASGGLWITLDETNILIDPGPGSLVRCLTSRPKLNPMDLDGILLSHRHLDHANDINILIEAMTNGGYAKKGVIFAPTDALEDDPVIFKYLRNQVESIEVLKEHGTYHVGSLSFTTPVKHLHGVETYGFNIAGKTTSISIITDTGYFPGLETFYQGDVIIINVVLSEEKSHIQHLCLQHAEKIFSHNKPRLGVLTHFGMTLTKGKPWEIAQAMSERVGTQIIAARDGMDLSLE